MRQQYATISKQNRSALARKELMPRTSSAKKALRVAKTNAKRNRVQRETLKKTVKSATATTTSAAVSTIAKAAKRGIISKARAARLTSRLMKNAKTAQLAKRKGAGATVTAKKPAKKTSTAKKTAKKTSK